ncbi:hypothetical protein FRC20_002662 [Serendipita sp. 405]|nr:hypothetical protein FRC20_002662 [Serendipita sp. 405]
MSATRFASRFISVSGHKLSPIEECHLDVLSLIFQYVVDEETDVSLSQVVSTRIIDA